MSNPCINRWGMNTFWYSFWYSDTNYARYLKQDTAFTRLVHTYLYHGIDLPYNLYANTYWYQKQTHKVAARRAPVYWRRFSLWDWQTRSYEAFSTRHETKCMFPMKLWILRYGGWLIINYYWFRPTTFKGRRKFMRDQTHKDHTHLPRTSQMFNFRRLKTLLSQSLFQEIVRKSYYKF